MEDPRRVPPTTTNSIDGDVEWELYNDDGFVYKRKKRSRCIAVAEETSKPPDPVVEERNRRIRKKKILLKLKKKYENEMEHWEILSNCLNDMQEKADRFQIENETLSFPETSSLQGVPDCSKPLSILDELIFMAERQEEMINEVTKLCEVAENMCNVDEEEIKQSFFDLPIWSSPRDLMASLCATD